jgi:hypothetical protein
MSVLATDAFRPVGPADTVPNDFVVPYYLEGRKLRVAVARVDDRVYAYGPRLDETPGASRVGGRGQPFECALD